MKYQVYSLTEWRQKPKYAPTTITTNLEDWIVDFVQTAATDSQQTMFLCNWQGHLLNVIRPEGGQGK